MAKENPEEVRRGGDGKNTAVDMLDSEGGKRHMLPVWFFVGILLLIYGILIFIEGIAEWAHPPSTVLSNLHPAFWWGILLIVLGAIFSIVHYPRKKR